MQAFDDPEVRAFAWRIDCNSGLVVTMAVIDRYVMLLSDGPEQTDPKWRLGIYKDPEDARRKAVEMTSSYERLRHGEVDLHAELTLPTIAWNHTVEKNEVNLTVGSRVIEALLATTLPA